MCVLLSPRVAEGCRKQGGFDLFSFSWQLVSRTIARVYEEQHLALLLVAEGGVPGVRLEHEQPPLGVKYRGIFYSFWDK